MASMVVIMTQRGKTKAVEREYLWDKVTKFENMGADIPVRNVLTEEAIRLCGLFNQLKDTDDDSIMNHLESLILLRANKNGDEYDSIGLRVAITKYEMKRRMNNGQNPKEMFPARAEGE